MVSDSFKFRSVGGIRSKQQLLEDDRVNREANTAVRFGGKQLRRG